MYVHIQKKPLTSSSSPAVPPQFVPGVVRSECAPSLTASIPGATIVYAPAIPEWEHTAVSLRRTLSAFSWQYVYKKLIKTS